MNPLFGISLKVCSVVVFMAMAALIKATDGTVPAGQVVFFRSLFAIPIIVAWLLLRGQLREGLHTRNPLGHVWRGLCGTTAMGLGFAALALLPLPEVTAIGYAAPLLTVVFAAMFLGEEVRIFRIATVAMGLVGVLIILSPRLSGVSDGAIDNGEAFGAMLVLTGAVFSALAQVFVRKLVTAEKVTAIVFYFSLTATGISLITLPFGWVLPDARTAATLIAAGLLGGVGQVLLTSSYRYAHASVVAPFEYASMVLALLVGYFIFDEAPTLVVLAGAAIVVSAGILIIWRERQLGLERARQRQSMTPQG
ncbi:MAG: DMT family transporter [Rhodobacteraceae bacterium]|uniref:DMT family transporter n=1 Tax=Albidovulum sp. TaxID=1872424 RepID=UPI001D5D1B9D|nr:DMT family transporter [Paracoccaceae bacterium]HPE26161.1 DMT family transporter [Albidovulum sp.]MCB2150499.1 DMT family transporter [Paracoccaceae bacterium]MCB2159530.1 DMT family transporter [Paracoccaceae bacterium]MCO5127926.1 DMT family transporter [Paracoccaceae bacterium]